MKHLLTTILLGIALLFPFSSAHAQQTLIDAPADDGFFRATVISIESPEDDPFSIYQAELTSGPQKGQVVDVYQESVRGLQIHQDVVAGEEIVVVASSLSVYPYEFYDRYRTNRVWLILVMFAAIVVGVTGKKGIRALIGLALTLSVIGGIIFPLLERGPFSTFMSIFLGAIAILIISLYISHGWKRKTHIALASSIISLLFATAFGLLAIWLVGLLGQGSQEAIYLQLGNLDHISLRGLLLGAMILGAVGVLDDVTIIQSSAVEELQQANPSLSSLELYKRSLRIGHEHIVSMVNTLFIAYAGAALPLLLFYAVQQDIATPLWVVFNSEAVMEELLRSIVGSAALVISVPLSSAIAAYLYAKDYVKKS